MKPVAILSTTVFPLDGVYAIVSDSATMPLRPGVAVSPEMVHRLYVPALDHVPGAGSVDIAFAGVPHYVGHPATKALLEDLGAVYAGQGVLFPGLQVGEACLCVPIVQGQSDRAAGGSAIHQSVDWSQLHVRVALRIA